MTDFTNILPVNSIIFTVLPVNLKPGKSSTLLETGNNTEDLSLDPLKKFVLNNFGNLPRFCNLPRFGNLPLVLCWPFWLLTKSSIHHIFFFRLYGIWQNDFSEFLCKSDFWKSECFPCIPSRLSLLRTSLMHVLGSEDSNWAFNKYFVKMKIKREKQIFLGYIKILNF